jgi:hypothetical protein
LPPFGAVAPRRPDLVGSGQLARWIAQIDRSTVANEASRSITQIFWDRVDNHVKHFFLMGTGLEPQLEPSERSIRVILERVAKG